MQSSVLLCISTLLESGNHYSRMFQMTDDDGKPVFETMYVCSLSGHIRLLTSVCHTQVNHACVRRMYEVRPYATVLNTAFINTALTNRDCLADPERCTHKLHTLPRWISSSKVDIVRRLLEDDPSSACPTPCAMLDTSNHMHACCKCCFVRRSASLPTLRPRRSAAWRWTRLSTENP